MYYSFAVSIYFIIYWTSEYAEANIFSSWSNQNIYGKSHNEGTQISEANEHQLWVGRIYQLKEHYLEKKFSGCEEVFTLSWEGEKYGRTFKVKCLKPWIMRNTYHILTVVLIGRVDDTFCLFGNTAEDYYYKDKSKWTKVVLTPEGVKEFKITSAEQIAELTEKIKRWSKIIDQHVQTITVLNSKKSKLEEVLRTELYNINTMKIEEPDKLKKRLMEIRDQVNRENLANSNDANVERTTPGDELQEALAKKIELVKQIEHKISTLQAEAEQILKQRMHEFDDMKNQAIARHDHAQMELNQQKAHEIEQMQHEFSDLFRQELKP